MVRVLTALTFFVLAASQASAQRSFGRTAVLQCVPFLVADHGIRMDVNTTTSGALTGTGIEDRFDGSRRHGNIPVSLKVISMETRIIHERDKDKFETPQTTQKVCAIEIRNDKDEVFFVVSDDRNLISKAKGAQPLPPHAFRGYTENYFGRVWGNSSDMEECRMNQDLEKELQDCREGL